MRWILAGVLAVVVLPATHPALAACISNQCQDTAAIERARELIQDTCGCTRSGQTHGTYKKCVQSTLKLANLTALIPQKQCRKLIKKCESASICGKLNAVVCCVLKKNGKVKSSIVGSADKCNGSACGALLGYYGKSDACAEDGTCAGPKPTTTTTTTPAPTSTTGAPTTSTTEEPTTTTTEGPTTSTTTTTTEEPTTSTEAPTTTTTTTSNPGPTTTTIFAGPAFPPVGGNVMFNFSGDAQGPGGSQLSFFTFSPTTWTALYWGSSTPSTPTAGLDGSQHALSFGGISGGDTVVTWQGTTPWTNPGDQSVNMVPIRLTITLVSPPSGVVWVDSTSITGLDPGAGTGIGAVVDVAPSGTAQDFAVKFEYTADIPTDDPTGFIPFSNVPTNGGGLAVSSFNGGFYSQP